MKTMRIRGFAALLGIAVVGVAASAGAQTPESAVASRAATNTTAEGAVPRLVQFSGVLRDAAGRAVSGAASVTFAIYAEQEGGAAIWSETQNVLADANGHYNAVLGAATAGGFPAELFGTGESRWLGVAVARQAEMPRALLASVPYALKAGDAQTLGGLPASSYVTTQQLAARTTAAAPSTTILGGGVGAFDTQTASTAAVAGVALPAAQADAASQSVAQVSGGGTAQYLPLWTSSSALGTSKIYQAKGGFVGINTDTPLLQLDVNGDSIFRGSFQIPPQGVATASNGGQPSHSFQWQGSVWNTQTQSAENLAFGFRAVPNHTVDRAATKLDLFYGPGGGTLTDTGFSIDDFGDVTADLITLDAIQVNSGSIDVDSTEGNGFGAIYGGSSGAGSTGVTGYGQEAGIYGQGGTYAGEFIGDVSVSGNLSKAGGSFKIDDPIDPAGKYLYHSFVESPDMKNVYDGVVTTDANGFATVTMPDWFEALNSDFRYQLTTVGQFAQAMVAKELVHGAFMIQTDKPNVKVSWQVTGIRQDAWAKAHRIPVEQQKSGGEQGRYLHPELFGHAGELAINQKPPHVAKASTTTAATPAAATK
jgi:hypothetical protein